MLGADAQAREARVDIAGWLRELGLGEYEPAFRENHIDFDVIRSLTVEDLKNLGIASIGHRRRLLDSIKACCQPTARRDLPLRRSRPTRNAAS